MVELVPVVLGLWVLLTIGLFAWRPGRDAALVALVGGWALLPTAVYPASVFVQTIGAGGSMHALAMPTAILLNKSLAIGLGAIAGVILFDWPAVRRLRFVWLDAPMVAWCLVPLASGLANGRALADGVAQTRYLMLAWGSPYVLGRLYLGSPEGLRRLGLALVLGGLLYGVLGVLEFVAGPFLYTWVYGPHPYQLEGAERFVGHRPLIFLEHGNQLGIWSACAAVAAVWLWVSGRLSSLGRLPGGVVAGLLVAACVLFQSHSAVVWMAVVLGGLWLSRSLRVGPLLASPLLKGLVLLGLLAVATALTTIESGGVTGLRGQVRGIFRDLGKTSFTWRLARSEENLTRVAAKPVLGWGQPDWSAAPGGTFVNPVNLGLWLTTLGTFGAVGLVCATAVMVVPIAEVVRRLPLEEWTSGPRSAVAMAAALLGVALADSLLNSVLLLPLLAAAGGINAWSAALAGGRWRA